MAYFFNNRKYYKNISYSPVISFMMNRLAGFSTSSFKVQALGSDQATANTILRFEIPQNSIVNLRQFSLAFKLATTGTGKTRLTKAADIIERISVEMHSCGCFPG